MEKEGRTVLQDGRIPREGPQCASRVAGRGLSLARGLRMNAKRLRGGEGCGRVGEGWGRWVVTEYPEGGYSGHSKRPRVELWEIVGKVRAATGCSSYTGSSVDMKNGFRCGLMLIF